MKEGKAEREEGEEVGMTERGMKKGRKREMERSHLWENSAEVLYNCSET